MTAKKLQRAASRSCSIAPARISLPAGADCRFTQALAVTQPRDDLSGIRTKRHGGNGLIALVLRVVVNARLQASGKQISRLERATFGTGNSWRSLA